MSSIKPQNKDELISYLESKGHNVAWCEGSRYTDDWLIYCSRCNSENNIKINSLVQTKRLGKDIVCKQCKFYNKMESFMERNGFTYLLLDDSKESLITCKDCCLEYHYTGEYFDDYKCYCKLKIKQDERELYEQLQDLFPDAFMTKEHLYHHGHKVDIKLELGRKTFLIEVDDENHFAKNHRASIEDKKVMKTFLDENAENVFFVRIPTKAVYYQETLDILEDFIQTVENDNAKILLFRTDVKNRYHFLDIPEGYYEIHHTE